jgi:lysophospholipase L1-like esterase
MKHRISSTLVLTLLSTAHLLMAELPFKTGEKVAFLGDSITQAGYQNPGGYVQLVGKGLAANGVDIEIIGAGISGHKSNQMLERLERDVLSKKPQWMTLSCGVNDVWHGANGVVLEDYKKNITAIVDQAQAAGVKILILTSTMIHEDQANADNQNLLAYNEFLRTLATARNYPLADLNSEMQSAVAAAKTQPKSAAGKLTTDGVHMAFAGNKMMAEGVLKGFGLNTAEIEKARNAWLDLPNTITISSKTGISSRQSKQLETLAAARKISVERLIDEQVQRTVDALLKSPSR